MRIILFLGIVAGILFSGCQKIDEFTKFDFDFSSSVTIPASSGINLPFDIFTPEIETNAESTFAVNDTDKELIEEILLKSMDLSIESPTGGSFTF